MHDIGKRIKNRRIELGMSAEDLAPLVGLSAATIYRYENGNIKKVNTTKLQHLAHALKTSEAYLMGWCKEVKEEDDVTACVQHSHASSEAMRIAAIYDQLDDRGKELLNIVADLQVKRMKETTAQKSRRVPIIGNAYNDGRFETKLAAMQEQKEMAEDLVEINE